MQDAINGLWTAGSGVLIAPDWVLTAGHNISGMGVHGGGISAVNFYLGTNIFQSSTLSVADAWYPYPGYSYDPSGLQGSGSDIGLIHLSQPIVDVAPAVLFSGEDLVGTHVYMAGFGQPAVAGGTLGACDGIKRAAENIADRIGGITVESQYWLAEFGPPWNADFLPLEAGVTPGDSGGSWFNDQGQIVGISSFVRGDYLNYGSSSGAIRVSQYGDWINDNVVCPGAFDLSDICDRVVSPSSASLASEESAKGRMIPVGAGECSIASRSVTEVLAIFRLLSFWALPLAPGCFGLRVRSVCLVADRRASYTSLTQRVVSIPYRLSVVPFMFL